MSRSISQANRLHTEPSFLDVSAKINKQTVQSPNQQLKLLGRSQVHPSAFSLATTLQSKKMEKNSSLARKLEQSTQKNHLRDSSKQQLKAKNNSSMQQSCSTGSLFKSKSGGYNQFEERHQRLQSMISQIKKKYAKKQIEPAFKAQNTTNDTTTSSQPAKTQLSKRSSLNQDRPIYATLETKSREFPKSEYYVKQIRGCLDRGGPNHAKEHLCSSMKTLAQIKNTEKPSLRDLQDKKVILPRHPSNKGKKTLVLDLEETLFHCGISSLSSHTLINVTHPNGKSSNIRVNIRPFAKQFIEKASKLYEITVFTSGNRQYSDPIIDYLDPNGQFVSHRLYKEQCWVTEQGKVVKDLRIFANRELSDIVLVDNSAISYAYQLSNGIPIIPFYGNMKDTELKQLLGYLEQLAWVDDVRVMNESQFKLGKYYAFEDARQLVEELYSQ